MAHCDPAMEGCRDHLFSATDWLTFWDGFGYFAVVATVAIILAAYLGDSAGRYVKSKAYAIRIEADRPRFQDDSVGVDLPHLLERVDSLEHAHDRVVGILRSDIDHASKRMNGIEEHIRSVATDVQSEFMEPLRQARVDIDRFAHRIENLEADVVALRQVRDIGTDQDTK